MHRNKFYEQNLKQKLFTNYKLSICSRNVFNWKQIPIKKNINTYVLDSQCLPTHTEFVHSKTVFWLLLQLNTITKYDSLYNAAILSLQYRALSEYANKKKNIQQMSISLILSRAYAIERIFVLGCGEFFGSVLSVAMLST